ncbi:hypothetical protein C8R45DRAFT_1094486 [Mycena sanguinolenta]|nr:hypothetical protein C8R45DRAFT_1094486 [Mycena sanguinolenta]
MSLICLACGHRTSDSHPEDLGGTAPDTHAFAASDRTALEEIELEIARLENRSTLHKSALVERRNEIQARLAAVVYPVLSLPTEITSHIFVECLPNDTGFSPSKACAPLLLMQVCRRWREIAVSTSELWSSLDIACWDPTTDPQGLQLGFETWFSRAGARPLSLTLQHRKTESRLADGLWIPQDVSSAKPLDISLILPRLFRLSMKLAQTECQQLISPNTPLPLLQSLHGHFSETEVEAFLQNAPALTALSWVRRSTGELDFSRFPVNGLTKLDINTNPNLSSAEFIGILQNFPMLADLACNVYPLDRDGHLPPLIVPNLLSLRLGQRFRYNVPMPPIYALELITLPALSRFECSLSLDPSITAPFLERSSCDIRELRCEIPKGNVFHAWSQIGVFRSVETLNVTVAIDIAHLLYALDIDLKPRNYNLILPKLRHITIEYHGNAARRIPIDYGELIEIVHRRREDADTATLKSFHLTIDESTEWKWCPGTIYAAELRRLISGGLAFTIRAPCGIWPE